MEPAIEDRPVDEELKHDLIEQEDWRKMIPEEDRPVVEELKIRLAASPELKLKEELCNDVWLARFSRARKRNVEEAWSMVVANIKWRADNNVDSIDQWAESEEGKELISVWPNQDYGLAKDGRPLICEQMVTMDPERVFTRFSDEDLIKLHIYIMERDLRRTMESSEALGRPITECVVVENVGGLGFHHASSQAIDLMKQCLAIDEKNYVEMAGALIVINAPMLFPLIYRLLKPFIDENTASKMQFHSASAWQSSPQFAKFVSVESLPSEWGGQSEIVWARSGAPDLPDNASTDFSVSASDKHLIEFVVAQEGSQLSYQFTTAANDIEFGIEFLDAKKKRGRFPVVVSRVSSHENVILGLLKNLAIGKYTMIFDNSYSYMTAKDVTLIFNLRGPLSKAEKRKMRKQKRQEKKSK